MKMNLKNYYLILNIEETIAGGSVANSIVGLAQLEIKLVL